MGWRLVANAADPPRGVGHLLAQLLGPWQMALRLAAMALVLALLMVPHLAYRLVDRWRSPAPMIFLNAVGWIAGLRVRTSGQRRRGEVLFVANHVSWLDILALGGAARSAFVSKIEVAGTPLIGWLADQNYTIYVERGDWRTVWDQAHSLRGALELGYPVTLFPEGTTGTGDGLLPFRASLFQAVVPPLDGLLIQPVWLDYGDAARGISWTGDESGLANAARVLRRLRPVPLTIHYLDPFAPADLPDRKAVAQRAQDAIASAMNGGGM